MSDYKVTTKFLYETTGTYALGERFPAKKMTVESKCEDLDAHEMLDLFKDFMVGCGYAERSFYDACDKASEENPYKEDKNQNDFWHSGGFRIHTEKTDQIKTN